ncbi:MAG: CE1759 family FMN reductase [Micropruina sp.]|nr:NAD(P)H-dependent oxidoreductase [Micropruina sp.]
MTTILVITAGMGQPSSTQLLGQRLGEATLAGLREAGQQGVQLRHVELRTLAADLASYLVSRVPSQALREVFEAVGEASGVIAVTPVFNASFSGLFKLFFDLLEEGLLAGRPVLLAATGGTQRHSLVIDHAMLPMFHYLKARVLPLGVFAATKDWGGSETRLSRRIGQAGAQFAELVAATPVVRPVDAFEHVTSFEDLLRG